MPRRFAIGGLPFKGPVGLELVPPLEGVYVVLAVDCDVSKVIEVGDAGDLRDHLDERRKLDRWARHKDFGEIMFGYYFVAGAEKEEREELSRMVRRELNPAGGAATPYISLSGDHFWNVDVQRDSLHSPEK